MSSRKKLAALLVILVILAGWGITHRNQLPSWATWSSDESRWLLLSGNIEAHESVLSFKTVQSRIVELPFNEGQWVKQGEVLARVDDADYRQQIAMADATRALQERQRETAKESLRAAGKTVDADEAEVAQRRLDLSRNADLRQKGFVSAATLDQSTTTLTQSRAVLERDKALRSAAEGNIKSAEAAIHTADESARLARIIQGYTTLTAPFDGVITVRQAELGEVVVPGTPVITIADLDHIWLRAYLNEMDLSRVKLGQEVEIRTDSRPDKSYRGRISFIAAKAEFTPKSVETHAERITLVYRVKIDIDNPTHELLPGMPADARIERR